MSRLQQPFASPQLLRDLRDIQYTVKLLAIRLERERSRPSQHAAALLVAVRYKLAFLETALTRQA